MLESTVRRIEPYLRRRGLLGIDMVIQATIAGPGLAVLPKFLIQEELASGRLVVAIDRPVTSEYAYYLVQAEPKADLRCVSVFRDWLLGQCGSR